MAGVEPDLPERRVPRQDRRVAPSPDERIDRVAHTPGPVLVVADAQDEPGTLEDLGVLLEVLRDRDVDAVAVRLGPAREGPFVREPPGTAAPVRDRVGPRPPPEAHRLPVRLGLHPPAHPLAGSRRNLSGRRRSNDTRVPPVYREGPPQSLYACQVVVDSTSRTGAGFDGSGRTMRNASARSSPAVTVTAWYPERQPPRGISRADGHRHPFDDASSGVSWDLPPMPPALQICSPSAPSRTTVTSKVGASVDTKSPTCSPRPADGGQQYASSVTSRA